MKIHIEQNCNTIFLYYFQIHCKTRTQAAYIEIIHDVFFLIRLFIQYVLYIVMEYNFVMSLSRRKIFWRMDSIFNCLEAKVRSIYKWVGDISHPGRGRGARTLDILPQFHLLDVFLKTPFPVMDSRGFKVIWWKPKKFTNDWLLMVFNLTFQMRCELW